MKNWFFRRAAALPSVAKRNIESVSQIEQSLHRQYTTVDLISDAITRFVGSISFIILHIVFLTGWIMWNSVPRSDQPPFDGYPFPLLSLMVALEAVILSTFVLMTQNRQNWRADHWAHINLQVSLLAEQETTKMLQMLQQICSSLGLQKAANDKEVTEMIQMTHVQMLAEELRKTRPPGEGRSVK